MALSSICSANSFLSRVFSASREFHAAKLRLPLIKRRLIHSVAPTDIGCAFARFLFLQDLDDLFFSKSLLHKPFLSRSDSTRKWRSFRGSGHLPECLLSATRTFPMRVLTASLRLGSFDLTRFSNPYSIQRLFNSVVSCSTTVSRMWFFDIGFFLEFS